MRAEKHDLGNGRSAVGPHETLGDRYLAKLREINRLEAEALDLLGEFDSSGAWRADGSLSCQAWVRSHGRMTAQAASARVRTARRLRDLPATRQALAAGDISRDHAQVIGRGTDLTDDIDRLDCAAAGIDADLLEARAAEAAVEADVEFARAACVVDPTGLRRVVTHWRHVVEPELVVSDEVESVRRRKVHLSKTLHGRYRLDGELDAEGGAVVAAALDGLMAPDSGDASSGPRRRTGSRKRADALVELARRALDGGELPLSGGERPHVALTVPLETLEGRTGSTAAELEGAGVVSGEMARRLACDAGLCRIITDGPSRVLDVGRRTRIVPIGIRHALVARDGGCAWPGCDRPPEWTDAHHVRHWADGGDTSLENLVLVCRGHHTLLHERHWQAELTPEGKLEVKPP